MLFLVNNIVNYFCPHFEIACSPLHRRIYNKVWKQKRHGSFYFSPIPVLRP